MKIAEIYKTKFGKHTGIFLFIISAYISLYALPNAYGEIIPPGRRVNWNPGLPSGIPGRINTVHTCTGLDSTGRSDASSGINSCISGASAGDVIYIPAGIYRLNRQLSIAKGITLRGAGPSETILQTYADWHGVQIGDWPSTSLATGVTGSPLKGDSQISVASITTPSIAVGDYIVIDQVDDGIEVINVDDQSRDNNTRSLSQITKVTTINGTTLTIDPPLYHSYSSAQDPEVWKLNQGNSMTTFAGVEDLTLERVSPTGYEGYSNFKFVASAYCWIKNVESKTAQFRHVDLDRSFRCEIRDSYFNDGMHHSTGGFAYGVVCGNRSTDNLVENNIFRRLRHSMVVKEGAAGCVFAYNYSFDTFQDDGWLAPDIMIHGAHATMNLFESNYATKIDGDFTHGSSSYNTFFRNYTSRTTNAEAISNNRYCINMDVTQSYQNFVGNVLGSSGLSWTAYETGATRSTSSYYVWSWGFQGDGDTTRNSTTPRDTSLRHGNYDFLTRSATWEPSIPDKDLSDSLYLTAKPSFFGNLPWPAIGADLNTLVGTLPAKERFDKPISLPPSKPLNLRILTIQ